MRQGTALEIDGEKPVDLSKVISQGSQFELMQLDGAGAAISRVSARANQSETEALLPQALSTQSVQRPR